MIRSKQYEDEKVRLEERFGTCHGRVIKIDLSLLEELAPRANIQVRSYIGLSNYLFRLYDCTLIVTSQRFPQGMTS